MNRIEVNVITGEQTVIELTLEEAAARVAAEAAHLASPEVVRLSSIDSAIGGDTTIASLKAMTNAEFDTWWAANVTNVAQLVGVVKRIARVVLRRLL